MWSSEAKVSPSLKAQISSSQLVEVPFPLEKPQSHSPLEQSIAFRGKLHWFIVANGIILNGSELKDEIKIRKVQNEFSFLNTFGAKVFNFHM